MEFEGDGKKRALLFHKTNEPVERKENIFLFFLKYLSFKTI